MKVELKETEELVRELSVEVETDMVTEMMDKAFAELSDKATIKGFRKGKAPLNVIKAKYDDEVRVDVAEELIRTTYPEAVERQQLKVASRPTIISHGYESEGTFRYTARVEVMPEIDRVEYDKLEITTIDMEVRDEDVDAITKSVRMIFADFRPVDREVQSDDVITVDLKKLYDPGMVLADEQMDDVEIDLGRGFTVKEFKEQLPGMKAGDEKEIEVRYDDDYPDPAFAGAHLKYQCRVKQVRERILPEVDDALAKRTGKAETALELRLKIREDIKNRQAAELRKFQKGQIIRQMCQQSPVPVPPTMVKEYLDAIVADEKEKNAEANEEQIRQGAGEIAEATLRWNMLYHHLARQENIEVSESDTEPMVNSLAQEYKMTPEQARQALKQSGRIDNLRDTLLEDKVLDFLISHARVVTGKKEDEKKQTEV
ncbi:MAG: trigger factor [bacterium]